MGYLKIFYDLFKMMKTIISIFLLIFQKGVGESYISSSSYLK